MVSSVRPVRSAVTDGAAPKRYTAVITTTTTITTSVTTDVAASTATIVLCQTRDEFHSWRARLRRI